MLSKKESATLDMLSRLKGIETRSSLSPDANALVVCFLWICFPV